IDGIDPDGPAGYSYQTTLDGVIANDNPEVDEFKAPQKLTELYNKKDYGRWAVNGTVPVAFIASNHTSGGNSGSPVLNAKGELIGTNFDRVWEGTMSDLYFDPNLCRNISLDIRYTLFIVEKFGNAGWLLKEMKIVNDKKK
ncbi:MAG: S46 family peptidase, partial [Flavipsychrobacter sp.]